MRAAHTAACQCLVDPDPAKPGGGGHQVPGKVPTDGGADGGTVALGLGLMALAGTALVRRAL